MIKYTNKLRNDTSNILGAMSRIMVCYVLAFKLEGSKEFTMAACIITYITEVAPIKVATLRIPLISTGAGK